MKHVSLSNSDLPSFVLVFSSGNVSLRVKTHLKTIDWFASAWNIFFIIHKTNFWINRQCFEQDFMLLFSIFRFKRNECVSRDCVDDHLKTDWISLDRTIKAKLRWIRSNRVSFTVLLQWQVLPNELLDSWSLRWWKRHIKTNHRILILENIPMEIIALIHLLEEKVEFFHLQLFSNLVQHRMFVRISTILHHMHLLTLSKNRKLSHLTRIFSQWQRKWTENGRFQEIYQGDRSIAVSWAENVDKGLFRLIWILKNGKDWDSL